MVASGQAQQQQAPVNNIGNLHYQHVSTITKNMFFSIFDIIELNSNFLKFRTMKWEYRRKWLMQIHQHNSNKFECIQMVQINSHHP